MATVVSMKQPTSISEDQVREALRAADGSPTKAAVLLGVHRVTVYKLMARYGIEIRRQVA